MEPFKNLINEKVTLQIGLAISRNYPFFNHKKFTRNIKSELSVLELKERVSFIALRLREFLPEDIKQTLPILIGALKKDDHDKVGLSGFSVWPLTDYVALFGQQEIDLSLQALREMTKVFTSEFAVRSFFLLDEKRTLNHIKEWANDHNVHVRRLASEGSRPLLPWGKKLPSFVKDPDLTWELLEILKHDEEIYVRKSVANHVNDHSKNHPDLVVKKLSFWKKMHPDDKNISWIIKHALRTLIKTGHPKAFKLLGAPTGKVAVVSQTILKKELRKGERLLVKVVVRNKNKEKCNVILDNEIHFLRSNRSYSVKCFKGKSLELLPLEKREFSFSIPLKIVTTRKYYHGKQFWNIKVNGISEKKLSFFLHV